jgi:surface protein
MAWMFRGCESLQNVDMTGVSTRYVKDMSFMFHECESLKKLDLSSFSFKNVQDVCFMFSGCSELEELDLNITDLNENECEMNGVLEGCTSLKPTEQTEMLLLQEAEHTDFVLMSGEKFNKVIPDDVKKIVFTDIFVPSNTQVIDVSEKQDGTVKAWITGEEMIVTSRMKNAPVRASWDCMEMFLNKDQLIAVDLSNLDTSNTITMEAMFYGCQSLKEISLQGMDTSSVMNMREMFTDCSSLEKVSAPSLDVSRVLYMTYMFSGCEKLKSLDLTGWKVPEQCVRAGMFEECSSLQKVPVFEKAENRNKSELSVTKGNDAIIKPNYERNSEQINLKDVKLNQEDKVMEL